MSTSKKSSPKKRHPLRKLVFLAVLVGIGSAIKNALEDKGGSYEAPAPPTGVPTPPTPSSAPAPDAAPPAPATSPVVTAEEIVVQRPIENLDEFADPAPAPPTAPEPEPEPITRVQPAVDPLDEAVAAEQQVDEAPVADADSSDPSEEPAPEPHRRARKRSAVAEALEQADKTDGAREDSPGKIDPFGIR